MEHSIWIILTVLFLESVFCDDSIKKAICISAVIPMLLGIASTWYQHCEGYLYLGPAHIVIGLAAELDLTTNVDDHDVIHYESSARYLIPLSGNFKNASRL